MIVTRALIRESPPGPGYLQGLRPHILNHKTDSEFMVQMETVFMENRNEENLVPRGPRVASLAGKSCKKGGGRKGRARTGTRGRPSPKIAT